MKFQCACGNLINDGGDDLPHKAHVIPDQRWNALFETLDDLIEKHCATPAERDAACTKLRSLMTAAANQAWQCGACGRLHLDEAGQRVQSFVPEAPNTPRHLFRSVD